MSHPPKQWRGPLQEHGLRSHPSRRTLHGAGVGALVPLVLTVFILTHHLRMNEWQKLKYCILIPKCKTSISLNRDVGFFTEVSGRQRETVGRLLVGFYSSPGGVDVIEVCRAIIIFLSKVNVALGRVWSYTIHLTAQEEKQLHNDNITAAGKNIASYIALTFLIIGWACLWFRLRSISSHTSPPGVVGVGMGGQLSASLRRSPCRTSSVFSRCSSPGSTEALAMLWRRGKVTLQLISTAQFRAANSRGSLTVQVSSLKKAAPIHLNMRPTECEGSLNSTSETATASQQQLIE